MSPIYKNIQMKQRTETSELTIIQRVHVDNFRVHVRPSAPDTQTTRGSIHGCPRGHVMIVSGGE